MPIIRVRTKAGTWRVEVGGGGTTIGAVKGLIEAQKAVPAAQQVISSDPAGATVLGDDLEATVSFAAAPAPYLLLVADENAGAGGYRQLSHDGYRLTCCVRPRSAPTG